MRKIDIGHEISGWSDSYLRQFVTWLFERYKFDRADLKEFTKAKRDTYTYRPADEHDDNLLDIFKRIDALCNNPHWTSERRWTIAELAARGRRLLEFKKTGKVSS